MKVSRAMVSSSKILTVSYGTFSCTAEGFEDPLAVVKDTTHFFRGVIREDRFFGAEPPQFDPEMAAELLQTQIASERGQGSLTLRSPYGGAASSSALSAALAAGPAVMRGGPAPVPSDMADIAEDRGTAEVVEGHETVAPEAVAPAPAPAAPEVATDPVEDAPEDEDLASAAEAVSDVEEDVIAPEDTIAAFLKTADLVAATPEAPDASFADEDDAGEDSLEAEAAFFEDYEEEPAVPAVAADVDSVAAKLRRIRAVVAGTAAPAPAAEAEEEMQAPADSAMLGSVADADEAGEPPADAVSAARDNLFTDTLAGVDFDFDEDEFEDEEDFTGEQAFAAAFGDTLDKAAEAGDDFAEDSVADEDEAEEVAEAAEPLVLRAAEPEPEARPAPAAAAAPVMPRPRVRVVKVKRAAFDAAVASGAVEEVEDTPASTLSQEDEDELARELAAVKAELKADFDAAWDEDEWDEGEDDAVAGEARAAQAAPSERIAAEDDADDWGDALDDDDEDDEDVAPAAAAPVSVSLDDDEFEDEGEDIAAPAAAGVAPVPAAEAEDDIGSSARDSVRKAVKMSHPGRVMLTESSVKDNDASRLLDETNTQMQEPEGNRRRSAIAHLRAAVAATRADKLLGRRKDSEEAFEPYREDLANVVRPRRPETAGSQTARPVDAPRPAPLKLVAEQRVDTIKPTEPARPRRVTLADLEEGDFDDIADDGGFVAYAESVGATELSELLEAAAAYMSYVEGREQFSRPQLMTKVRQVEVSESSREDRLRSFGQLLREGKIEKTRGGRFTASDRISFKPERAAG
ncbi:hypothetical protein [Salipiger sp.]|uniref:hypothetical protein n=1 Tax=Salipiger sp. TaxID=2078585 RepID=UPI003A96F20F